MLRNKIFDTTAETPEIVVPPEVARSAEVSIGAAAVQQALADKV